MKSSCITHPVRAPMVIVRSEYLTVCEGKHCAAALLNHFEHLTNSKLDEAEQVKIRNQIAAKQGLPQLTLDGLWIYKTQTELKAELLGMFTEKTIREHLKWLQEKGFLYRRNNPNKKWDRTIQYRLDIEKVNSVIASLHSVLLPDAIGTFTESNRSESPDAIGKSAVAIPETTSKTTTETTQKKTPKPRKPSTSKPDLKPHHAAIIELMRIDGYDPIFIKPENLTRKEQEKYCDAAAQLAESDICADEIPAVHKIVKAFADNRKWSVKVTSMTVVKYSGQYIQARARKARVMPLPPPEAAAAPPAKSADEDLIDIGVALAKLNEARKAV